MARNCDHQVSTSLGDLRSDLGTALVLALVGLGFTLMSASTFASVDRHCATAFSSTPEAESDISMNPEPLVQRAGSQFACFGGGE